MSTRSGSARRPAPSSAFVALLRAQRLCGGARADHRLPRAPSSCSARAAWMRHPPGRRWRRSRRRRSAARRSTRCSTAFPRRMRKPSSARWRRERRGDGARAGRWRAATTSRCLADEANEDRLRRRARRRCRSPLRAGATDDALRRLSRASAPAALPRRRGHRRMRARRGAVARSAPHLARARPQRRRRACSSDALKRRAAPAPDPAADRRLRLDEERTDEHLKLAHAVVQAHRASRSSPSARG